MSTFSSTKLSTGAAGHLPDRRQDRRETPSPGRSESSLAADHARFGQAGPLHGSAPDGGATDFLDLFVGVEHAAASLSLCQPWSAHKAHRLGLIHDVVPAYKDADGRFVPNPFCVTERYLDEMGRIVHGEWKGGAEKERAKQIAAGCTLDLSRLDDAVARLVTGLLHTFPDCTRKTLESLRKKKLEHWYKNGESSRSWLSLNMNTEALAGFNAFHHGEREQREIDFVALRRRLAEGRSFRRRSTFCA